MKKNLIIMVFFVMGFVLIIVNCVYNHHKIINGYTDKESYFPGEVASVFLNPQISGFKNIHIYDLKGNIILTFRANVSKQIINSSKPWENGFNYEESFKFRIPNIKSGVYLIENQIPFIVKSKTPRKITLVYPSNTVNAYNSAGGKSAYTYNSSNKEKANILSFNRPRPFNALSYCKEFLIWLNKESSYDINYICDLDLEDYSEIANSEIIVIPGHSEYWTRQARKNFDRFIDEGGHALILSGNTMYWQVRYTQDKKKMVIYKDHKEDPEIDSLLKTDLWNSTFLRYPTSKSIGVSFENGGFGGKNDEGWDGFKIVNEKSPLLRGTGLSKGSILKLKTNEYDGAILREYINDLSDESETSYALNLDTLNAYRGELIGYDYGYRNRKTIGTFIVYQRSKNSGIIVNASSTNWCNAEGISKSKLIRKITKNMFDLLLSNESLFNEPLY